MRRFKCSVFPPAVSQGETFDHILTTSALGGIGHSRIRTAKGLAEAFYGLLTDVILHMEIMLGHVDIGVSDDALDRGQVYAQGLHLGHIGVTAAVRCQNPDPVDFSDGFLEFLQEVIRITGLILHFGFLEEFLVGLTELDKPRS